MLLNCLFLLTLAYYIKADSEGYPLASDDFEGSSECGPCQQLQKSKFGEMKCVAIPYCCPGRIFVLILKLMVDIVSWSIIKGSRIKDEISSCQDNDNYF